MSQFRKTRSWLLLAFFLLPLVLMACGGTNGSSSGGKVTISYLTHWSGDQLNQLNQAVAAYEKTNPNITINVRNVPFGDLLRAELWAASASWTMVDRLRRSASQGFAVI